ncbi:MAG: hypothetical protein JW778_02780 [Candidatus Altiarchaeota archaeon]|nr:hypothetical protein [Candidatus Altiarchaeota archaeon]
MHVLWCVTGAGHLLQESADFMRKNMRGNKIAVAFSGAGCEVAEMYGLLDQIERDFKDVFMEDEQGSSSPLVGRLAKKEYDLVIVSPCTANTVAKIVTGVADSLVSNIAAQAVKSGTPLHVVPTDYKKTQETMLPLVIDPMLCRNCETCPPLMNCPKKAIYRDDRVRANMLKCNACKKCVEECTYSAISFGKKVRIHIRDIDIENTKRLGTMEGIQVYRKPDEIKI